MEKPSHKIAISVTATLIATAILRFTTSFTFTGAFRWFRGAFNACWNWAVSPMQIAVWLLCLLIVLSVGFILVIGIALFRDLRGPSSSDYRKDSFDGLVWRWSYYPSGGIRDPWCFCPTCDQMLVYSERGMSGLINFGGPHQPETLLQCEYCSKSAAVLQGSKDSNVDRIVRLIDRKIRVGEWQEAVARYTAKS